METNNKTQWKKRVHVFQYVYSCLMNEFDIQKIKDTAFELYDFDADQLKLIEYFGDNFNDIMDILKTKLSDNWQWDRIVLVDKSILITAYCESKATKLDKAIIIDQAIINAKHYSDEKSYKFINAVLDKIL